MRQRLSTSVADGKVSVVCDELAVLTYHFVTADPSEPWRLNFIHPLAAANGACLTEDAPADHHHHRGVFWAWRRMIVDGEVVGDGWVGRDLAYRVEPPRVAVREDGDVEIMTDVVWSARMGALVRERAHIVVGPDRVELEVRLRALSENVMVAGTDDEKGYGGPSIRFAHSDRLQFESEGRALAPEVGAVETGGSVDFSWDPRPEGFPERVRVACSIDGRPWTKWVLRRGLSMQNCAFPGREPFAVPTGRDLAMRVSISILS